MHKKYFVKNKYELKRLSSNLRISSVKQGLRKKINHLFENLANNNSEVQNFILTLNVGNLLKIIKFRRN